MAILGSGVVGEPGGTTSLVSLSGALGGQGARGGAQRGKGQGGAVQVWV